MLNTIIINKIMQGIARHTLRGAQKGKGGGGGNVNDGLKNAQIISIKRKTQAS